jgi:hypothetical protein
VGASIVRDVELTADALTQAYSIADTGADPDLTEIASLVLDAAAIPAAPVEVPDQQQTVVYDPTGAVNAGQLETGLTLFPEIPADVAAAILASNTLPVVVQTPDAGTERPIPRP